MCVFYYCRTYYKAVRVGGGGEWRTCAMRDDEPRPVWMSLMPPTVSGNFRGRKWNIFVEPLLFREIVLRSFSLVEGGSLVGAVGGGRRSAGGG